MTHGEKILLVAFIIAATAEPPSNDVAYVVWRLVTIAIGVTFANWHFYRGKKEPPASVGA